MGLFHVYVEAPDRTPAVVTKLAVTIGKKYGIPVADLEKRLLAGRFRVKANVDRATADAYAKSLAESGVQVKIEDAVATPAVGTPVVPAPEPGTGPVARSPMQRIPRPTNTSSPEIATPLDRSRAASSSLPPQPASRPASSSLPPPTTPRPASSSLPPASRSAASSSLPPASKSAPIVASGLSAAFTESGPSDLGALGGDSIKLASLDGKDTGSQNAIQDFGPVDMTPAIETSAAPAAPAVKPKAKPNNDPIDLFAPPDAADDAAFKVELAADEVEHRAKKTSTPPAGVPVEPQSAAGSQPVGTPQLQNKKRSTPAAGAPVTVAADAQETPRWRLAAGVFLAIILGFIPAHIVASIREGAYAKIDATVSAFQDQADTPELQEKLDEFRDAQQARKDDKKKNIAMVSIVIWAISAGGLGYVWFRRVPWHKLPVNLS